MSKSIKALSEKRAEIEAGLKALLADGETRDWTAEDEQKYDAYFAEDSKIKAAIERIESVENLGSQLNDLRDASVQVTGKKELGDPELENKALRGWLD